MGIVAMETHFETAFVKLKISNLHIELDAEMRFNGKQLH